MRMIKWAADIIDSNITEAERYARKAHELREVNKQAADWCRDMATMHLQANTAGHAVVKKLIEDYAASGKNSELAPGMRVVYNDRHVDMMRRTAEAQALLSMYK